MRHLTRRSATALGALLLMALPAWAAQDQEMYDRGRNAVFEERWSDARNIFEELTRRFPSSSFADDAHYWLGMSLYELGRAEEAYTILKQMTGLFPDSPWNDDSRVLMVRCAESALKSSAGRSASKGSGARRGASEYEAFIERSTRDQSAKVQLLAIDTMLGANPGKARELLPRLSSGKGSHEAAEIVLDRFFGGETVKVTLENPALGLREGNVAVMVRQADQVTYLSLLEATEMIRSPGSSGAGAGARFNQTVVAQIRDKLLQAERNLAREGDPRSVQSLPGLGSKNLSAIIKVVDGEIHYYRDEDEVVRILVLSRGAGFTEDNIKIFVESRSGTREIGLSEARRLPSGGAGGPAGTPGALRESTVRYLKAALAIIEIDLARAKG